MRARGVLILGILFFVHQVTTAPLEDVTEENEVEEAGGESEVAVEDPDADALDSDAGVLDSEEDEESSYIEEEAGLNIQDDDDTAGASESTEGLPELILDVLNNTTTTEVAEPTPIEPEEATAVISGVKNVNGSVVKATPVANGEDHYDASNIVNSDTLLEIENDVCRELLDNPCMGAEDCQEDGECTQLRCYNTICKPHTIDVPLPPEGDGVDALNDVD